jgi:hypothetical protein
MKKWKYSVDFCGLILMFSLLAPIAQAMSSTTTSPQVDIRKIKKIYYLLASGKGVGQSTFGHSYLRLSFQEDPRPDDLVLELVADVQAKDLSVWRGLGFGENYKRTAELSTYQKVQYEMNYTQQRDLQSTEILLSEEQRTKMLLQIQDALNRKGLGEYSFFDKNCAEGLAVILKSSGIDTGKVVSPNQVQSSLKKLNLAGKTYTDLSLLNAQTQLLQKHINLIKLGESLDPNFRGEFLLSSPAQQLLGFVQLLEISRKMSPQEQNQTLHLLKAFAYLQPRTTRLDWLATINGKKTLKVINLLDKRISHAQLGISSLNSNSDPELLSYSFYSKNESVFANFNFKQPVAGKDSSPGPLALRFEVPVLSMDAQAVLFEKTTVGIKSHSKFSKEDPGIVFPTGITIPVVRKKSRSSEWTLSLFLVLEKDSVSRALSSDPAMLVPILNDDGTQPSCYGFVDLQKALLERAVFFPEGAPLPSAAYVSLIANLLRPDSLVIFPGVGNVQELFSKMDSRQVRKVIYQYHRDMYTSPSAALKTYFNSEKVSTTEELDTLQALISMGTSFTIHFRFIQNGQRTALGHALLIKNIVRKENRYYFDAYDPNLGRFINDMFYFDVKSGKFHTVLYGITDIKITAENIDQTFTIRNIIQSQLVDFLKIYSEQSQVHAFTLGQILQLL